MRIVKVVLVILFIASLLALGVWAYQSGLFSSLFATEPEESTTEPTLAIPEPKEEDFYPEAVKQLLAKNEPYSLEYTSNGDGTCYVSKLYLNNRYTTEFDIIIPETSPAGDTVTGIDLGDSLTSPGEILPKYMTKKRLDEIKAKVEADYPDVDAGYAGLWWVNAYKVLDVSKMTPDERAEVIEQCPLAEHMVVAEFWPKMSNTDDTFRRVKMARMTPSVVRQYYQEFIQEAREAGVPEELLAPYKELMGAVPAYANYSDQFRYLHIPKSVKSVDVESLYNLLFDDGIDNKESTKGIVLPELDLETIIAIDTNLRSPHYRFIMFYSGMSPIDYEWQSDFFAIYSEEEPPQGVRAWRYVDGVPTLWHIKFYPR